MIRLQGETALITGGGTGLGRAIALAFAREGANVSVAGRRPERLEEVAREIERRGGQASVTVCDVTRAQDASRAVAETTARFERLSILVNNAGTLHVSTIEAIPEEEWDRVMAVNVKGPFLMSRAALPELRKARGDHQHRFGSGIGRGEGSCSVLHKQRRRDHVDQGDGSRPRARKHSRE